MSLQTSGAVAEGDGDRPAVVVDKLEAVTASTKTSDDYMHRDVHLHCMCLYVYRMYVRRVRRPSQAGTKAFDVFHADPHYVLARSYSQDVVLHTMSVPTIDGFQCPTVHQDAEQNALLKALLLMPFSCNDPMMCCSVMNFRNCLSLMVRMCTRIRMMLFNLPRPRRLQVVLFSLPSRGNTHSNELGGFGIVR